MTFITNSVTIYVYLIDIKDCCSYFIDCFIETIESGRS